MDTSRSEQIYNVYYFNEKDPFGVHSRSFYKIRDRFVLKAFSKYFSGSHKQMLDIASGPGTLMKKIFCAHPELNIICSDMNPVALKFLISNTTFNVIKLKLPNLDGVKDTYDIVSCFDTYYLLNEEDMKTALDRIYNLLSGSGGIFIVDSDLSDIIDPLKFRERERVFYFTDKLSKVLFFSIEEKFRNKYYVLKKNYREKLIEYKLLPEGFKPRLKYLYWVIYYLLYSPRMINKLLYSSVLANQCFACFGKEKYEVFVYEKL